MNHNFKYKIFAVFILVVTAFLYKATNLVALAKNSAEKKYDVYTLEVGEIPVPRNKVAWMQESKYTTKETTASLAAKPKTSAPSALNLNSLTAKAVYVEDIDSATPLFEKNAERLLLPASTTKIMTALVVRDEYDLDKILTVPNVKKIEGSSVGLFFKEKISVRELLKAALIQSSNDAAYTLAMNHPDGLEGFVKLMNIKAKQLGLRSSIFENPAGFDAQNQRSSAHDLAIMSKELMKDSFLRGVVKTKKEVIFNENKTHKHYLYNTHQLLGVDTSVVGVKTGTTGGAGEVLITQFNRDGKSILVVIMGSEDRYKETLQLIDWVFDEFVWLTPKQIIEKS